MSVMTIHRRKTLTIQNNEIIKIFLAKKPRFLEYHVTEGQIIIGCKAVLRIRHFFYRIRIQNLLRESERSGFCLTNSREIYFSKYPPGGGGGNMEKSRGEKRKKQRRKKEERSEKGRKRGIKGV